MPSAGSLILGYNDQGPMVAKLTHFFLSLRLVFPSRDARLRLVQCEWKVFFCSFPPNLNDKYPIVMCTIKYSSDVSHVSVKYFYLKFILYIFTYCGIFTCAYYILCLHSHILTNNIKYYFDQQKSVFVERSQIWLKRCF